MDWEKVELEISNYKEMNKQGQNKDLYENYSNNDLWLYMKSLKEDIKTIEKRSREYWFRFQLLQKLKNYKSIEKALVMRILEDRVETIEELENGKKKH